MQRNRMTNMTQFFRVSGFAAVGRSLVAGSLFLLGCGTLLANNEDFTSRVKSDTAWLSDYGTRQVGTEGHRAVQEDLLSLVQDIPNIKTWTQSFTTRAPVEEESYLEIMEGPLEGQHKIHPFWPEGVRLNNTPDMGIRGRFVYIGEGEYDNIPARSLRGQIAVMELSGQENYRRAFDFGAAAVVFLASETSGTALYSNQSLFKPRYYVTDEDVSAALREGNVSRGRIYSRSHWKEVEAQNIYAGIVPEGSEGVAPYVVVAPYDSMSRVMGIAPGADAALDAAIVLNLLRDQAENPTRPLLFAFVDAYHINQLGMRKMSAMLGLPKGERTRSRYESIDAASLSDYEDAAAELETFEDPEEGLARMHSRREARHLRRLYKDAIGPDILHLSTTQGEVRLASLRGERENTQATRASMLATLWDATEQLLNNFQDELSEDDIEKMEEIRAFVTYWHEREEEAPEEFEEGPWSAFEEGRNWADQLLPIVMRPLNIRNRVMGATHSAETDVRDEDLPVALLLWDRMVDRIMGQLEMQRNRLTFFDPLDDLRVEIGEAFGLDTLERTGAGIVLGIDLSDSGVLTSIGGECEYHQIEAVSREVSRRLRRALHRGELWPEDDPNRAFVNTPAMAGRTGGMGNLQDRALITAVGQSFGLPGVTWVTDDAPRRKPNSPLDDYESLRWSRIEPQIAPTLQFFKWFVENDSFSFDIADASDVSSNWRHGMGRIVDVSAGETVPRVPRVGFLVTLAAQRLSKDGIQPLEFDVSGADGTFRIPLLPAEVHDRQKSMQMHAFRLDRTGAITEGISTAASMVTARLATGFHLGTRAGEQLPRAVTFEARELNGPSFFDARYMEPLKEGELLDTVRGGTPDQHYFSVSEDGQMWGIVPSHVRWQLIMRAGAARVRMALLNALADGRERGLGERETFLRGFAIDERLPSIPSHVSSRDLDVLNSWRLQDYRAAGIASDAVDIIRDVAGEALRDADAALEEDDGAKLQRSATVALSNEIRAYQAVRELGQDVTRGAIFLMLMLVPFSIAMERLLFARAKIGGQITASIGIFAVMTGILWSFHPAFRISAQPLIIVMAFTILAMAVVVIGMVLSRFKASVRQLQSTLAEGSGAKMGRGGLIMSAVFLGIANMRKRKVRTALTGTTVVLVTFALLGFSSTSSYVDRRDFRLDGVESENPAVLVRRPTFGALSWTAEDVVRNLLGEHDVTIGERVWVTAGLGQASWRLHAIHTANGVQAPLVGALGLPANENHLSSIDRVLPNWTTFAEEGGCYISSDTASLLDAEVGDTLVLRGEEVVVRGIFDPLDLEHEVKLIDGQRILPYDFGQQEQDWLDRDSQEVMEQEGAAVADMQPDTDDDSLFIPAENVIILTSKTARKIGGDLRSIGIACDSPEEASLIANKLAQTIAFPSYYTNDRGGVNVLVSTPLIALPPRNIAIPLAIAALIIFTTILNSVSERKGEIYVYTSLGLAPTHVGALFVAEALTYGMMGAVFGYIAGQGVATFFTGLGFMQGITLNYSGTAVISVMLLVQLVVVLSAIVPAIMAGKIASPSTEMDWHVPEPVDGEIHDLLPFTVSKSAARGLISFIYDYLEAHRDGVLGVFDVDDVHLLDSGDEQYVAGLQARLWLEPYDMGVRQTLRLRVNPEEDGACTIGVVIRHEAGAPKVWWRLNRPFFMDVRRQLLGWRKLSPERLLEYVKAAENL